MTHSNYSFFKVTPKITTLYLVFTKKFVMCCNSQNKWKVEYNKNKKVGESIRCFSPIFVTIFLAYITRMDTSRVV